MLIKFINSWAQGIILAVIIATIIEIILPEGKNKKYVKTVIGIYILFTIIYPIVDKLYGNKINLKDIMKSEIYASVDSNYQNISDELIKTTNKNVESSYIDKIESEIKLYLENKDYSVKSVLVCIETKDDDNYGAINSINIVLQQSGRYARKKQCGLYK